MFISINDKKILKKSNSDAYITVAFVTRELDYTLLLLSVPFTARAENSVRKSCC